MQLFTLPFSAHDTFAKTVLSFDTEIMKKLEKFQYWAKNFSYKKTRI